MTAQTYHGDDYQLAQRHDQAAPENSLMEPDAHLTESDTELAVSEVTLAEPDTELAVSEVTLAEPDTELALAEPPAEPDTDQAAQEDPTSHQADAAAMAGYDSAAAAVSEYPGFTVDGDDGAQEPGIADSNAGSPLLVSAAFTAPDSAAESHLAGNGAHTHGPWNEIQAMFVDDPRASIERAAGLVDDRVEALIQSVRERQRSMQSAWRADDAGTEELRVALQHYRSFWNTLADLPAQA